MTANSPLATVDDRKTSSLGTQIELMLNPGEKASSDLEEVMDRIYKCKSLEKRVTRTPTS